ncbi:peptidoglycan DD-metalloendopeptidase family protein [Pleurocapsales cyanobacterium LEGE 06147]|nr:peptidoglycan DD-metalloendopeptidase family protein [Pleurocapsales cyanobacterium LEGE 06147]
MHSQDQNLLPLNERQMQATAQHSSPRLLASGTTRKTRHSATMLGLAISMGATSWGWFYQAERANAATSQILPQDPVLSHLKLEEATLSEKKLENPKSSEEIAVMGIGHPQKHDRFQVVNWASKSDRLLKQQQVMLQNLKAKWEQSNTSLEKLKAKNFPSGHATIRQPISRAHAPLTIEATPTTAIPQLPALTAPQTIQDNERQIYQVREGDTVEIIARRYNTTRERLIEANKLKNPDLIFVAQQLKIPVVEPSKSRSNDNPSSIIPSQLSEDKNSIQLQTTEVLLGRSQTLRFERETTAVSQPFGRADNELESAAELYTDKLRSEVIELREQYQNQIRGTRDNRQATSIQLSNYETPDTSSLVPVRTLPKLSNLTTSKEALLPAEFDSSRFVASNSDSPQSQDSLVSTAPSSVKNYNQMFRIPVGESVAPELPPLSSPDRYLPGGTSSQFDGYIWPSVGVFTSGYGWRWGRMHRGIDIAGPIGTPIVAAAPGEVISAGWSSGGYGNLVEIEHGDGSVTLYAHNNKILVRRGQWVEQGEQIAEMGSTGYSTGPHLHFEIRPDGQTTANPIAYLPKN